jgi:hypothetical protein
MGILNDKIRLRLANHPGERYLSTLKGITGLSWTLTYILIIKRGFQDQTFGMPMVALCTNISWEFIFAFIHPHRKAQRVVNTLWFLFDVIILFQILRFGFIANLSGSVFYVVVLITLVLAFCLTLFITYEFNDWQGKYTAFGGNLLMSILFITMLLDRGHLSGQSIYIALFKMIGTAIPSIALYLYYPPSKLINFLGLSIFVFDLIYLVLVYQKSIELGLDIWARF